MQTSTAAFKGAHQRWTTPLLKPEIQPAAHRHVLIADDDSLVRGSLAAVLESEGFVVDEAQNGITAVTRAIEHPPNLGVLDLNIPHWVGWTAFSRLNRITPCLPGFVYTSRTKHVEKS